MKVIIKVLKALEIAIILFLLITTLYYPKDYNMIICTEVENRDRANPELYCKWSSLIDDVLRKGE